MTTVYEPEEPAAVRLGGVGFAFGRSGKPVLRNLSLAIPGGTISAILGPNGVGKTTLLNLILGWLRPREGSITLFGRKTAGTTRREMGRTISLVPQDEHIPFEYTTLDYVLLGRAPHLGPLQAPGAADLNVAWEALERVGIAHLAERDVAETSGGEKQLALVARALAQEPRILLMDEPTAHLDLKNRRRIVDLIHQLHRDGVTVVFTTHDPELASVAAERVILLEGGHLLAEGPVRQVMTEENLSRAFTMDLRVHALSADRTVVLW
ncbi:MAG: ABC transporter ATP-binding protein [Spirochaetaceae bacterium]|nr:MAG: ABC transporter ATP-binding protein [Spirochaetaceae bacterium]